MHSIIEERALILPLDLTLMNLFMTAYLSKVEYIGCNRFDYWQYLIMRIIPFVLLPLTLVLHGLPDLTQPLYIFIGVVAFIQFLNMIFFDLSDSMDF